MAHEPDGSSITGLSEDEVTTSRLLTARILRRHMQWFLVNEGELEDFRKMDSGSGDNFTLGIAAITLAVGLFASSLTITSEHFTLPQLVMFYMVPAASGILGLFYASKGRRGKSAAATKRDSDINRIRTESQVAIETTATRMMGDSTNQQVPAVKS